MSSSERTASRYQRLAPWVVAGLLLVAIAVVYGQAVRFNFLGYDDPVYVFDNPMVRSGLTGHGIVWAFTDGPFGEWYPLTMLTHMLDCQLFGLDSRWHHLTNLLLHAATAIGLFLVLRSMTAEIWPSAFVAMLFAVHPQHVESVVWIAERRDVLSGVLFVLTMWAYLVYVRHGRSPAQYALVAFLFTLGLMAKPILVTFPALLIVLDYWPLGRFGQAADLPAGVATAPRQGFWWLVVEKLPLLAIALAVAAITLATHGTDPEAGSPLPLIRLTGALVSPATYLFQFFYPVNLAIFYPLPAAGYPLWKWAGALAILAAITAGAFLRRRECPYLLAGWLWFLGTLVPVLGLVQVSHHAMADRYTYLSTIGLSIALAWGASRLAARWAAPRWLLPTVATIAIVLLTLCAARQTLLWRDDETLWRHALALTADNAEAETGLADALRRADRLDEALEHYQLAVGFEVNAPLLNNLGITLLQLGRFEEAADQFRAVIQRSPNSALAHDNLGRALLRQDALDEAAEEFHLAIKHDRSFAMAWIHLAQVLQKEGQFDGAIADFERGLELDPAMAAAHRQLAALLAAQGRANEAIAHYRAALTLAPVDAEARTGLEQLGVR